MEYKAFSNIGAYYRHTVESVPEQNAQLFNHELYPGEDKGSFTWEEMNERVEALAGGLLKMGVQRQEKVAIMSATSPYWTHVDMALTCIAAVSVTIYPTLSNNEVSYIMNDSGCRYLLADSRENARILLEDSQKMPGLEKIIVLDLEYTSDDKMLVGMGDFMKEGRAWLQENRSAYEERLNSLQEDDLYTILYTSGTTGAGKGVLLTHWCATSRLEGVRGYFEKHGMVVTEKDVTLCFLPLSHIFDRGSCQLLAVCQGSTIAYADKPGTLLEDMQKYNPTWINCVPRLYEKIYITFQQQLGSSPAKKKLFDWAMKVGMKALQYRDDGLGRYNMHPDFDLKSKLPFMLKLQFSVADKLFAKVRALFGNQFRYSFSASAGISEDLLRFFYTMGFPVIEGYGSTESFNACILNPITACKPGFVGKDANGSKSRVADDGELEISGAGIFKGYLNRPEENAEVFTEDGWFRTGDLVVKDDGGYVKIVDRKKAIICTATGKNVAPAKLENLFSTSPVIEQVFLVGDERNFITALLVPNFNHFTDLYEKKEITFNKTICKWSSATGAEICYSVGDDFVSTDELKELVDNEVKKANEWLERFEQIKKYAILTERFTEENGMLTPTQKTKKRVILETYADRIDALYAEE